MNHSQMPIIPQRCDYLMTTTFIGVVLLQPPKRKEEKKMQKKKLYFKGEGKFPARKGGRWKQQKNRQI